MEATFDPAGGARMQIFYGPAFHYWGAREWRNLVGLVIQSRALDVGMGPRTGPIRHRLWEAWAAVTNSAKAAT